MKKLFLISILSLFIISCNNEEKKQEQQSTPTETTQQVTQEQQVETTETKEITEDITTENLEEKLTEMYKDKGITDISAGAYAKGTEAILLSDGKTEISEEEFKKYATDIANLVRKVKETPEATVKVYLQLQENGEYKDIYTGEF